jgi:hypothetical protein
MKAEKECRAMAGHPCGNTPEWPSASISPFGYFCPTLIKEQPEQKSQLISGLFTWIGNLDR